MNEKLELAHFYSNLPHCSRAKDARNRESLLTIINYQDDLGNPITFALLVEDIPSKELAWLPHFYEGDDVLKDPVLRKALANPTITACLNINYAENNGLDLDEVSFNRKLKIIEYYNIRTGEYVIL